MAKILVFDDNYGHLRAIVEYLEDVGGYEVMGFESDDTLVEAVTEFGPNLAVVDHRASNKPRETQWVAYRVAKAIRSQDGYQSMPIIVYTAWTDEDDIARLRREVSGVEVLSKNASLGELLAMIHSLLER